MSGSKWLVERLRLGEGTSPDHFLLLEAADEIESLCAQHRHDHQEIERLTAIAVAAEQLLSLVEAKGQPRDGPENQALLNAGDIIYVNEGNLWALQSACSALEPGAKPT